MSGAAQPETPYQPPREVRDARPVVILWFRVYAGMMALLSVAMLIVGAQASASLVLLTSAPLAALFAVAAFIPFKPWGWSLGLVAIVLGLASLAVPFAIPLFILWFRPTVKAAFARL